ncbi:CvpA family protein [Fonticella tunisiensis]|uniref:Colicin V production protein n=1 Tax=Fonticella tunisiensis TaxID=1096341 RepID=A0A4R7KBL5_9CLOT|nr:CvpA family protein [Fonticella tunisiensis]TDT50480.1 colicin V production protein [Fonticella tunisiensis]
MGINWLDITIVLILSAGALTGMMNGFIVSIFNIAGIFISMIIAKNLSPAAADFIITHTSIYDTLKSLFIKRMSSMNPATLALIRIVNSKNSSMEDTLTIMFINIAVLICIFMISTVILNILRDTLKITVRKTSLKYVDIAGGLVIGVVKAAIFIFIFFAVVTPLMGIMPQRSQLIDAIGTSKFAKYFYQYNFMIQWLQKLNNL